MSSFKQRGYLHIDEVACLPGVPSRGRTDLGPCAVIECAEHIPCNPCESACPRGAVVVGKPITNLPHLDEKKCVGCGLCIAHCPGQAIFVVDTSNDEAHITLPFEFLPVPKIGDVLQGLDRSGNAVSMVTVAKVAQNEAFGKTVLLTISTTKDNAMRIRAVKWRA